MKTILVCAAWLGAVAATAVAEGETSPDEKRSPESGRPHREDGGKPHRGDGDKPPGEDGARNKDRKRGGAPFGGRNEMFKRMDANEDGLISKQEFFTSPRLERLPEEKREELFGRLDSDGDGNISKDEIHDLRKKDEERAREFRELDLNKSGGLDFAEFSEGKFFKRLPEEKRREIFSRLDSNKDGEVSPEDRPKHPGKKHRD